MSELFETILQICNVSRLKEMANYQKRDLSLPVNIWLDKGKTYQRGGHYKRVKFQINYANSIQKRNFASISLDTNKVINKKKVLKRRNCEIDNDTVHKVETFCANNNFALSALADEILSESEFLTVVIKGGEVKTEEDRTEAKEHTKEIIKRNLENKTYDSDKIAIAQQFLKS